MSIFKVISAVLVTAVISVPAMSAKHTWGSFDDDGTGTAYVKSERFNKSTMVVYAEPERDCQMRVVIMTEIVKQNPDEIYVGGNTVRMRIDKHPIWTNDKANTYRGTSDGNLFFDTLSSLDGKLFGEMLAGAKIIVQVGTEETNAFSLIGFSKAINEAITTCENAPSEWDVNAEYTGDEWDS